MNVIFQLFEMACLLRIANFTHFHVHLFFIAVFKCMKRNVKRLVEVSGFSYHLAMQETEIRS